MDSEKFRVIIDRRYKAAMQDCQVPTGALAYLNRAEFFAYEEWEENKRLRTDLINLSVAMREIRKSIQGTQRALGIIEEWEDITCGYVPATEEVD